MATIQLLKKKLAGILSIQKVSKALKMAATVKFSRLSTASASYADYAQRCRSLYAQNRGLFDRTLLPAAADAPVGLIVMAGNKGMCGSFNNDVLGFAAAQLQREGNCPVLLCGRRAQSWFEEHGLAYEQAFVFDDVPCYADAERLFAAVQGMMRAGRISGFELVYPRYRNMMKQEPVRCRLTDGANGECTDGEPLFFPDRDSVVRGMAGKVLTALLYEKMLECALGAQAATLMTMRSAYDTAMEYSRQLEGEINQKRQSRVTADVIETSSEFSREVD